jgi:hypothetical protein
MLKQEKTPKKKLIIYALIIAVMFFATGFMIYKNYKLTAVNNSVSFNNNSEADITAKGESAGGADVAGKDASKNSIAELNIFNDQKFNALKRNLLKKVNFIVGKENPFEARNTR